MVKKAFISILLLLTYSLGFAHNFVPHNHSNETEEHAINHENEEHHHHHNSVKHLNSNHEHIFHGDHYDDTIYDLLFSFMHDTHNHENDCEDQHYITAKTNRIIVNKLQANKFITTLFSFIIDFKQSKPTSYSFDEDSICLSPSIEDTPLRGPPLFS